MSSLLGGIGKIFTSLGSGLGATLGSAVRGVGASLFTAGAATGTGLSSGLSNLFGGGGGVLSNMINGAARIFGGGTGAAGANLGAGPWGAALGAVPAASAAGASSFAGPWGASPAAGVAGIGSGLFPASTPTGYAPGGIGGFGNAVGGLLNSPLIPDLAAGYGEYSKIQAESEAAQALNQQTIAANEREQKRRTDSYNVAGTAYAGGAGYREAPVRPRVTPRQRWVYNGKDVVQEDVVQV